MSGYEDSSHMLSYSVVKDLLPELPDSVVLSILQCNAYDVEKSTDVALALSISMENELDAFGIITPKGNEICPPNEAINKVQNNTAFIFDDVPSDDYMKRGSMVTLPKSFLAIPRFRTVVKEYEDNCIHYTVYFRRCGEKLGLTIQEVEGDIVVLDLHSRGPNDPYLALKAGVRSGDFIVGIDHSFFSPDSDVQDVLDMLHLSGDYVALHFRRDRQDEPRVLTESEQHSAIKLFLDNNVITQDQVSYVHYMLLGFRHRAESWSSEVAAERIASWKLDSTHFNAPQKSSSVSSSSTTFFDLFTGGSDVGRSQGVTGSTGVRANSRRVSTGGLITAASDSRFSNRAELKGGSDRRNSTGHRAVTGYVDSAAIRNDAANVKFSNSVTSNSNSNAGNTKNDSAAMRAPPVLLRPALSLRILHAEDQKQEYIVYVVWVHDVQSGLEWVVRRRFSEFFSLREELVRLRQSMDKLDFPPKRLAVSEPSSVVEERLKALQRFMRRVVGICTINTLHPSTIRIQLALQQFLGVDRHSAMIAREVDPNTTCSQMVQVFVHSVLYMAVMDKVVLGSIARFIDHQAEDLARAWTAQGGVAVAVELRGLMDHLQNFLCESLFEDCLAVFNKHNAKQKFPDGQSSSSIANTSELSVTQSAFLRLNEDEVKWLIRSAIRRQVEVELFVGCSARIKYVLRQSFARAEKRLQAKIARIIDKPQSYFGVREAHRSPSDWMCVVSELRDVRHKTLPMDRIDWLVQVCQEIPKVYQAEHQLAEKPLGADDILPIFIYVLVQARVSDLLALNYELQTLCDPDKRLSETGYYLATLEASLQHLIEAEVRDGEDLLFTFIHQQEEGDGSEL